VEAGNEPSLFTQHFRGWDHQLAKANTFVDPYETRLAALKAKKEADQKAVEKVRQRKREDVQLHEFANVRVTLELDGMLNHRNKPPCQLL